MGAEHKARATVQKELEGGEGSPDAAIIEDCAGLGVQGDVEVDPDKDSLAVHVYLVDCFLGHAGGLVGHGKAAYLFDSGVGNYALSQDGRAVAGYVYDGRGLGAGARAPVDYQVDLAKQLIGDFLGGDGIWASGNVGAGAGYRGSEGGGELPGDRVVGDSHGDSRAPAIDEAGDVGSAADYKSQCAGPEGLGEGMGETPGLVGDEREVVDGGKEKGDGLGVGSSLGVVEPAYGGLNERVCAESVKGVGRESDEAAALKNRDSLFDVGCAGG